MLFSSHSTVEVEATKQKSKTFISLLASAVKSFNATEKVFEQQKDKRKKDSYLSISFNCFAHPRKGESQERIERKWQIFKK